jgi:prolyl oligopeptidase
MSHDSSSQDPFIWLEEIDSPRALSWVKARNAETLAVLCDAQFERDRKTTLDILNAPDRIAGIKRRGPFGYYFWRDAAHPKGIFRRTTLESYRTAQPDWDTIIDLDALAKAEGEDWVWAGAVSLAPEHRLCIIQLSRGGADANVIREYDLTARQFVKDGFVLPESKAIVAWVGADTLLVSSTLGGERFETTSGYSRTVRRWRRGTPFEEAQIVFECEPDDLQAHGFKQDSPRFPRIFFNRQLDFENALLFVGGKGGAQQPVEIPPDAEAKPAEDWLVVTLRSDWQTGGRSYPAGALLVIGFDAFTAGARDFAVLFAPTPTSFLQETSIAGSVVAFSVLDNVRSRLFLARVTDGRWQVEPLAFPDLATLSIDAFCYGAAWLGEEGETFVVLSENSVTPPTMSFVRFGERPEVIKQARPRFAAKGIVVTQHEAISVDGARIPYFQIGREDIRLDGSNPVLMTGYGGYQTSSLPQCDARTGNLWLERGGVYVIANIRGGGEFGPNWHRAGMREGKKLSQDDFAAVAKDLIARGVTRPDRIACEGGSNGGLLVGNMLTRYPELFGAVECAVPLLDMQRYTKLTAGASWITEYGDPDVPDDWAFLQEISAYHLVEQSRRYPPILLTTSARDDRVHPAHARKMAAKLLAQGHQAFFYEPPEGGHGGATDNVQSAFNTALGYSLLRRTIAPEMTEDDRPAV